MKDFFEYAGTDQDVDLVILDPDSLNPEQLQKMKPVLMKSQARISIFGGDKGSVIFRALGVHYPTLPLAFSRSDLLIGKIE